MNLLHLSDEPVHHEEALEFQSAVDHDPEAIFDSVQKETLVDDAIESVFDKSGFSGPTIVTFANGDKYEGNTKEGKFNGEGVYTYQDGTVYSGDFYCGEMWGQCTIAYPPGREV